MNTVARNSIVAAVCLALSQSAWAAPGVHGMPFSLTSATPSGWTINYMSTVHASGSVVINGQSYMRYESVGDLLGSEGTPGLPIDVVNLGIPRGAALDVSLKDVVYETIRDQRIAPHPSFRIDDNHEAIAEYHIDPAAYEKNAYLPASAATAGTPFSFRQQVLCPIRVAPLQYNPALHLVRRIVRATIVIQLRSSAALEKVPSPGSPDPLAEGMYKELVLNYDQAKQWREPPGMRPPSTTSDSTRAWFNPLAPYVKMGIVQDGWYRVSRQAFQAIGVTPDLPSLRLVQHGREIPAIVEGDSVVSFYALRNRGDSTYYDFFSDTSYVWMTWGSAPGLRYVNATGAQSVQRSITSAGTTVHFELNTDYYVGTGYDEITNTFDVPGEGWVWEYYYPGTQYDHPFVLDNVDTSVVKTAVVSARLYSTTSHASTPDHIAAFTLNGSAIGQVSFNGRTGAWPSFTVAAGLLAGSNDLRLQSIPTATPVNQFYLDWFEVAYRRKLVAVNDWLRFQVSAGEAGPASRFRVSGFSTSDVIVADVSNGRVVGPDSVVMESGGTFTIVFSDTLSNDRTYAVTSRLAPHLPVTISRKQFVDLRSLSGADYIVLTNPLFRTAANQLAAQRRSTRNLRAQVVDVTDVYDEFNYGVVSPFAIKRFLQYAYLQWPGPAPSNLVIMGDASWDPHHYMATTVMNDYIPAFGVPSSDNWYTCFDTVSPFIPSMNIGRLTVMDSVQALNVVSKIIGYDATPPGEWDKRMLFMTAGGDSTENTSFAQISDNVIANSTAPAPLGAENIRAYKMSPAIIDGSMKPMLMQTFNSGISFVSFLGHSGGRIWGLDAGSPYDLQNTSGQLPFIVSVSCNVGGFATPTGMVLAEDYLLADHRGAIAMWASASLGYPSYGTLLLEDFLGEMTQGTRLLGAATTSSRILLWEQGGNNYITLAHQYLTPLLGDPLSQFAVPVKPDLSLQASDVSTSPVQPTTADSTISVTVTVRNFGTVPAATGSVNISDTYNGHTVPIASNLPVGPVFFVDSVSTPWHSGGNAGQHTLGISVSLPDSITEVSVANNALSFDRYVYANSLQAIRPLDAQVVPPGPVRLVVASQAGISSSGLSYTFELDTVAEFDSPSHIVSPAIAPKPVSGEWTTPSLPPGVTWYWRSRTVSASGNGRWMNASFSTTALVPQPPLIRWSQLRKNQFALNTAVNATPTDSGVTIASGPATLIRCRSLGNLANADKDYYTIIQVGLDFITGLWWNIGNSYMVVQVNSFDGTYVFKPFDLYTNPALADSMATFISTTPTGFYVGIVAMAEGRTNVDETLYSAIESLGSQKIRQVQDGQAWALIARKGFPAEAIEAYQTDSVIVSKQLPTIYGRGGGTVVSPLLPVPVRWQSFQWQTATAAGLTSLRGWMIGIHKSGGVDTLKVFTGDSAGVDLRGINTFATDYAGYKFGAFLSTNESAMTPRIISWSADFVPTAELALQALTQGGDLIVPRGTPVQIPLSVYNIGYRRTDSISLQVGMYDPQNRLLPLFSVPGGGVSVDSSRAVTVTIPTSSLSQHASLELTISPADSSGDLFRGNNSVAYGFTVTGVPIGTIDVFADGVGLMDGDYISTSPRILVRPRIALLPSPGIMQGTLLVDGVAEDGPRPLSGGEVTFSPRLDPGNHLLKVILLNGNPNTLVDTIQRALDVTVSDETRLMQVFNYPNPFSTRTEFTFVLAGSANPDAARIRIYTVAGRKIRDIALQGGQVVIGYNKLAWDGRDDDGDTLANGVYFYQIEVSLGGKTASVLGKMAKVR